MYNKVIHACSLIQVNEDVSLSYGCLFPVLLSNGKSMSLVFYQRFVCYNYNGTLISAGYGVLSAGRSYGGGRQRYLSLTACQTVKISLARAVYHSADIYLVDNVLNAVDEKTSTQIFTK